MKIAFQPDAWDDYEYWRTTDKVMFTRLRRAIADIVRDPFAGSGAPKPLRYAENLWARRLDLRHRILYRVTDDTIEFLSMRGHYWYDR